MGRKPKINLFTRLLLLIAITNCQDHDFEYGYAPNVIQYTRQVHIKQGVLQGVVVESRQNRDLPAVEQYLGIPYAAPPIKELRFMPPGSAPSWFGIKYADTFGAVCTQKLPDRNTMSPERADYFEKLLEHLITNQSEDCLYLNIYAPVQELQVPHPRYPVMVFLHGESYEWNSGNPYDGSVLAAYGRVIVITLNFRLGVFGFLQTGVEQSAASNFGLVDQVAALLWIQENIAAFGGDPSLVTLIGHGTGAVCANLLMLSAMVVREHNKLLFHRAILMGGSALADWALQERPREVTSQIADTLKCPPNEAELPGCLRNRKLNDIINAAIATNDYVTNLGPIADSRIIPNNPKQLMSRYTELFKRFDLMYGVTEIESAHVLGPVASTHGLLSEERDMELMKYMRKRCEIKPEQCKEHVLQQYADDSISNNNDKAKAARDQLLELLSDARALSSIVQTGRFHAAVNPQSYFYVFGHTSSAKQHLRSKTVNGDELPYVFGVPLDGPKSHFVDQYTAHERLLSEVIMKYFSNFAYFGNPNVAMGNRFLTLNSVDWLQFDVDWPEFNLQDEAYMYLAIPPQVKYKYKSKQVTFWNEVLPQLVHNTTGTESVKPEAKPTKSVPPWVYPKPFDSFNPTKSTQEVYGTIKFKPHPSGETSDKEHGTVVTTEPESDTKSSNGTNLLVIIGCLFLCVNILIFVALYYKCIRLKNKEQKQQEQYQDVNVSGVEEKPPEHSLPLDGCNFMRLIGKPDKGEDIYTAVRVSDDGTNQRYKLTRETSSSTIDAHTKVREWIAHEIVQRCSPRFLRRTRHQLAEEYKAIQQQKQDVVPEDTQTAGSDFTIGQTPTRPVSPEAVISQNLSPEDNAGNTIELREIPGRKLSKISVAIDATPSGRGASVLQQRPVELTRSVDYSHRLLQTQRSATLDDSRRKPQETNLSFSDTNRPISVLKIQHGHSRSDPVDDFMKSENVPKNLKSFEPDQDVSVTCQEEAASVVAPLSPEQQLQVIKRRNFPKVLPDFPGSRKEGVAKKRLSMPVTSCMNSHSLDTQPLSSLSNQNIRLPPPAPPPRTTSSLAKKTSCSRICTPAALAEEPPLPTEPELTFNNLYIGPLLPAATKKSESTSDLYKQNIQQIYGHLRPAKSFEADIPEKREPKTIITADADHPVTRVTPKVIIKPTIPKKSSDVISKAGARVIARNSSDESYNIGKVTEGIENAKLPESNSAVVDSENVHLKTAKPSLIPTLIKGTSKKESSSSDSSPSDTGTVVKRTVE